MMRTPGRWLVLIFSVALLASMPLHAQQPADSNAPPAFVPGGRMMRGTVTAVSPDQLTVKTEAGETFQVALSANTHLRKGRDPVKATDIHPGDGVGAMGELDPATKTLHALFVGVVSAEQIKQARENLGKTYIAGKVLAVNGTSITVLRPDSVQQTIAVDEDTSFRKSGRGMREGFAGLSQGFDQQRPDGSNPAGRPDRAQPATADNDLTLADVTPGKAIAGAGAMKNGVFVASRLGIFDPTTRPHGRQHPADGTTAGPAPEQ